MATRPQRKLSLKARAIGWLAQREHSRSELRRKLLARLAADARAEAAAIASVSGDVGRQLVASAETVDPRPLVDELLDWLEAHDYLSAARFTESRVNVRAARFGSERIRHELARHGLSLEPEALRALKDGELDRARAVWLRKFGSPATDAATRARQARFLAARGFAGEVIRRVVQGLPDD